MKIYQPTISSSAFIAGLTTASQASVLTYDATTGQVFYTASSAIGGGGGGPVDTSGLVTTASFNAYTGSSSSTFAGTAATASYADNFTVVGTLSLNGTLTDHSSISSTAPGPNNLFTRATGSFTSAFCKYTLYNGANSRAGEFVTSWNGTTTSYYDNSTVDIGDTSAIVFEASIVTGQVQINTGGGTPSGWTIKMLVTYI